ncbi:MAG: hypothetical protein AAGA68_09505 [Pseudomonadota bacterium]
MKTSLLDKSVAIGVVVATYVALIALWAPRLEGSPALAPDLLQGPFSFEADAGCAVEMPPAHPLPAHPPKPSRRGFWL